MTPAVLVLYLCSLLSKECAAVSIDMPSFAVCQREARRWDNLNGAKIQAALCYVRTEQ